MLTAAGPIEGKAVYIEDGIIADVLDADGPLPSGYKSGMVIKCARDHLLAPCTYNAYTHAAANAFRVVGGSAASAGASVLDGAEKHIGRGAARLGALAASIEMVDAGVCGFLDMSYHYEEVAEAAASIGLRVLVGPLADAWPSPQDIRRRLAALAVKLKGFQTVSPLLGIYRVAGLGRDTLSELADAARQAGARIGVRASVDREEVYLVKRSTGKFPVELLHEAGVLGEDTVVVCPGWAASWELSYIAESGSSVVYCPSLSMASGYGGHIPLSELIEMKVNVGVGTGNPAAVGHLDVLREAHIGLLLQRYAYWDPALPLAELLRAASEGSGTILGAAGKVVKGAPADIVVYDLSSPRALALSLAPDSTLAYLAGGLSSYYTVIAGRVVYGPEVRDKMLASLREAYEKLHDISETLLQAIKTADSGPNA
ncbi:MAG: amidohydrolase family protein [Thermoproteota archaeon]